MNTSATRDSSSTNGIYRRLGSNFTRNYLDYCSGEDAPGWDDQHHWEWDSDRQCCWPSQAWAKDRLR